MVHAHQENIPMVQSTTSTEMVYNLHILHINNIRIYHIILLVQTHQESRVRDIYYPNTRLIFKYFYYYIQIIKHLIFASI